MKTTMDVKFINPFMAASVNLFKNYLGLSLENGKPFVRDDPAKLEEISAVIGLAGEVAGAVVLSFSKETAIQIVSRFAGQQYQTLGGEVLDGVGELVNIIAGNAKKDLASSKLEISLPGVITGNSYEIHWPENVPVVAIPFKSDAGDFSLNVSIREAT
jgi:chemotaxis protein CheX